MERNRIIPMSGSEESFQTQRPPTQSYLELALRYQVVSAILIIGGLLPLSSIFPLISIGWVIAIGVLYALGFLQLIILRTLLQKVKYSVHAAGVVALLAGFLSSATETQLLFVIGLDWRLLPLIVLVIVNIVLFYFFFNIHLDGGIKSGTLGMRTRCCVLFTTRAALLLRSDNRLLTATLPFPCLIPDATTT
ncbi:MAG: hypothetical protein ACW97G_03860 [Candidatus Thorarchaeota archaeon]